MILRSNEAVEKVPDKTYGADVDHSGTVVSGMHAILRGQILHANSGKFKMGLFYSFNGQAQGRAACWASLWSVALDSLWPLDLDFSIVGKTVAQIEVDKTLIRNAGFLSHALEVLHNIS